MRLYFVLIYYLWRYQNQNQTNDDPVDIPRKSFKFN